MAQEHADWAYENFDMLENRLEDFLRTVPFEPHNFKTTSPMLVSLLLDFCSLTEAILKSTMDNNRYNNIANIAQIRLKRYSINPPYLTISDLRTVFRSDVFYHKRIWLINRGDSSFPWYPWRFQQNTHPRWWNSYNKIKHDRFADQKLASLLLVLHASKACFLTLILSLDFRTRMIERGVIRAESLTISESRECLTSWEPINVKQRVIGRSRLFGYQFKTTGHPKDEKDMGIFL